MLSWAIPGMRFWWLGNGEKCGKAGLLTVDFGECFTNE